MVNNDVALEHDVVDRLAGPDEPRRTSTDAPRLHHQRTTYVSHGTSEDYWPVTAKYGEVHHPASSNANPNHNTNPNLDPNPNLNSTADPN